MIILYVLHQRPLPPTSPTNVFCTNVPYQRPLSSLGALSAGTAKYFGGGLPQRVMIGAAMGGVSSVMAGGDFARGAFRGAWTSAIAYVCNDLRHKNQELWKKMHQRTPFEELNENYKKYGSTGRPLTAAEREAAWNDLVDAFKPDYAGVDSYLRGPYVQGQFQTYSNLVLTSPSNIIPGFEYTLQNVEPSAESWAFRIEETLRIIKNVVGRR